MSSRRSRAVAVVMDPLEASLEEILNAGKQPDSALLAQTPERRKPLALSMSSLGAATPSPLHQKQSIKSESARVHRGKDTTRSSANAKLTYSEEQRAGEMDEEMEHALAACDQLLHRAKSQASAASLTRSFTGSSRSFDRASSPATPYKAHLDERVIPREPHNTAADPPMDFQTEPTGFSPSSTKDASLVQATTALLRSFVVSCQRELEREAEAIAAQSAEMQHAYMAQVQRKWLSKKKMALLTLREQKEREGEAELQEVVARYEKEQRDTITKTEKALLEERQRMLQTLQDDHERDTEDRLERLRVRLRADTMSKRQALEANLKDEMETHWKRIEEENMKEQQRWEEKTRLAMERELLQRREKAADAVLREQELQTNEMKKSLERQHSSEKEQEEMEKLRKALAFGAQAQVQQLKVDLQRQHDEKLQEIRANAAKKLADKLEDLRHVLAVAHQREQEQVTRELEQQHRVGVMELHEQLERDHHTQLEQKRKEFEKDHEAKILTLRRQLEGNMQRRCEEMERTLAHEFSARMDQLERDHEQRDCDALLHLQKRIAEQQQDQLNARHAVMKRASEFLVTELRTMTTLSTSPDPNVVDQEAPKESDAVRSLCAAKSQLPSSLQRHVTILVREFDQLAEEQRILLTKIGESTSLYLTFKRRCAHLEDRSDALEGELHELHEQLRAKDAITSKLYTANEALLKRLGIVASGDELASHSSKAPVQWKEHASTPQPPSQYQ